MNICEGEMKMRSRSDDAFRDAIRGILLSGAAKAGRQSIKNRIFSEVQSYSTELQEVEHASDLFFRLCELIVDCQSLSMPDDSFRIIVAYLLSESEDSPGHSDEEVRELLGMDFDSFEEAKEHFKDQQCVVSSLNREKTGRKGAMMAGKGQEGAGLHISSA
jgi:hypothetical protein